MLTDKEIRYRQTKRPTWSFLLVHQRSGLVGWVVRDLVNRSFRLPIEKDGSRKRTVIKAVDSKAYEDYMNHVQSHKDFVKFCLKVGDEEFDKLVEYNWLVTMVFVIQTTNGSRI